MIRHLRVALACLSLIFATAALAQDFPPPISPFVNDFADLLSDEDEAALTSRLKLLRDDAGVEMTLVTILRRADYGKSDSIENFATGLFNNWGIGNASRNDGILVLVAREDREMRIELGTGYDGTWNRAALLVIEDYFLPSFRADNYARGILTGMDQTIAGIARRFIDGDQAETGEDEDNSLVIFAAVIGLIALLIARRRLSDWFTRYRACPSCGRRGLRASREVTREATEEEIGQGLRTVSCAYCEYSDHSSYTISQKSSDDSSFGGGSSSGGGASGRW